MIFSQRVSKIAYSVLGMVFGAVALLIILNIQTNKIEDLNAKINYQSGCLLIATRISEKQEIAFDYQKFCETNSESIYITYLDLSIQMDKIMGF